MIIKNITEQTLPLATNILPLKKNNVFSIKIDKSIEIVVVPNFGIKNSHQPNVGIILEEVKILKILSKRYKSVSITTITSKKDLEKLVIRKPDLVFSGVKYFLFKNKKIWLNDYLDLYEIPYIASNVAALNNESDKNRAKKIMQIAKIKTADFFITNSPGVNIAGTVSLDATEPPPANPTGPPLAKKPPKPNAPNTLLKIPPIPPPPPELLNKLPKLLVRFLKIVTFVTFLETSLK